MSDVDLFGNPITAPVPVVRSAKDEDDARQVVWRPYKGPSTICHDCAEDYGRAGISPAQWVRRSPDGERFFCYRHKFEEQDRERRGIGQ